VSLDRLGRDARFRLLHDAFRLTLAPPPSALVAAGRSRVRFELYQQIPALRMLALPRPRILNASDVGLGKTVETGIALRELIARRRGGRILIVCPAGITDQWRDEMAAKFGLDFKVFDRDGVHEARKAFPGSSPRSTTSSAATGPSARPRASGSTSSSATRSTTSPTTPPATTCRTATAWPSGSPGPATP
jgi:hypothetical protein